MTKGYSLEMHMRVYDDSDGQYLRVGADGDGLDLVEVMTEGESAEYFGTIRFALRPDMALLLAEAMIRVANDIKAKKP